MANNRRRVKRCSNSSQTGQKSRKNSKCAKSTAADDDQVENNQPEDMITSASAANVTNSRIQVEMENSDGVFVPTVDSET
jgi:vacuolar-type H+-ATPase subunit D/Vma8